MKNIWLISNYTLREALAKKVFIVFFSLCLIGLILFALIFSLADLNIEAIAMGEEGDLAKWDVMTMIYAFSFSMIGVWTILIAIFSSSGFVPEMMQKGNIDLLLSKPVSRDQIILGKFLGVNLFILINLAFLFLGIWLIVSFKFQLWDFNFLWVIIIIPFTFAILYSIIMFFGLITGNSIIGMMIAYFIFIIFSPLLAHYQQVTSGNSDSFSGFDDALISLSENSFADTIIMGFYYIVPKTSELLSDITPSLLTGNSVEAQPIITSVMFLAGMIGLTMFIFRRKDF
jgi:ABC-type transport system involved in multi-copper enzyme maturation permease subunit